MTHVECITQSSLLRFITSKLKSTLRDYSDACILFKAIITVPNTAASGADANNAS